MVLAPNLALGPQHRTLLFPAAHRHTRPTPVTTTPSPHADIPYPLLHTQYNIIVADKAWK